jgi:hypothetical protein
MNLKQFKGDEIIENKDAFQAAAFDAALTGCDVVVSPHFEPNGPCNMQSSAR